MNKSAFLLRSLVTNGMPVLDMLECRVPLSMDVLLDETEGLSPFGFYRALGAQVREMMLNQEAIALKGDFAGFEPGVFYA